VRLTSSCSTIRVVPEYFVVLLSVLISCVAHCGLYSCRSGLEMPVSLSFIQSCLGHNGAPGAPDDLKAEFLRHLNLCVGQQESARVAQTFFEQVLGSGNQESYSIDALVIISSAIARNSGSTFVQNLYCWIFRNLACIPWSSVTLNSGHQNDAAVAAISSLCRYALFETTDVDLCALCLTLLHHWIKTPPPNQPLQLVPFLDQPPPPLKVLCSVLERASPSLSLSLSPAVTTFFASFFTVPELPDRGLHLLVETLKSFSGDRPTHNAGNAQIGLDFHSIISSIMQPSPLGKSPVRLASELCVRWDVRGSVDPSLSSVILCRSAEAEAAACASAAQAAASGNQSDFEEFYDLQCCSFLIHARHASAADTKLFESALEKFLCFTGVPTPSLLAITCLAASLVLDSNSSSATVDATAADNIPSDSNLQSSQFASGLSRAKQFEIVTDAIMALLRACRAGSEEGVQVDTAPEAASSALGVIRSISARLALKASRIDMVHLSLIHCHCSVFDAASLTRYTDGHAEVAAK
jgi:hypothetical protein